MLPELNDYNWAAAFKRPAEISMAKILHRHTISYSMPTEKRKQKKGLTGATREDVAKILYMEAGENDAQNWIGIFELKDGRFISVDSGCDYTGWDCQAGGTVTVSESLEDLIRYGISQHARERFKIKLPEDK